MHHKFKLPWVLVLFLLGGLLVSLYFNYRLIQRNIYEYAEHQAVRLNPYGLSAFDGEADKTYAHPLLVFYGDSRAALWDWPTVPGLTIVNRAIGNQTSVQVIGRFDAHLRPLKPDIVVLQVGINDIKSIPVLSGQKADIIAQCKANIGDIVRRLRSMGATVIVTTIFPRAELTLKRRLIWSDDADAAILEVNDYIRSLAGERVIVYDTHTLLVNERGLTRSEYSRDFLHLNSQAYEMLNVGLVKLLEKP